MHKGCQNWIWRNPWYFKNYQSRRCFSLKKYQHYAKTPPAFVQTDGGSTIDLWKMPVPPLEVCRPLVALASVDDSHHDKKNLASQAGETKKTAPRERCGLSSFAFYFEAVLSKPLAPDQKTKLRWALCDESRHRYAYLLNVTAPETHSA